jgi:hypothetical protein
MWKKEHIGVEQLLPSTAFSIDIPHWWTVCVGFVSEADIKVSLLIIIE